jgi:hypothetical protein
MKLLCIEDTFVRGHEQPVKKGEMVEVAQSDLAQALASGRLVDPETHAKAIEAAAKAAEESAEQATREAEAKAKAAEAEAKIAKDEADRMKKEASKAAHPPKGDK